MMTPQPPRARPTAPASRGQADASVLVIDDNRLVRQLVRATFEPEGYAVIEAANGQSALQLFSDRTPGVVLQDLILPDIPGVELVKQLRALPHGSDVPILAFSGFLPPDERLVCLQAGFTDYLFKPVEPSRLLKTVRGYLRPTEERVPEGHKEPGRGRRVVVADDDPVQLKLLQINLEHAGFNVQTARDGVQALELAQQWTPEAIVSDVLMPRLDGFRLCQAIRNDPRLGRVPVLLLSSAYDEAADQKLAREVGANRLASRTPHTDHTTRLLLQIFGEEPPQGSPASTQFPLEDYTHRVIRQLERQLGANVSMSERLSMLEARFSIFAALTRSLKDASQLEQVLNEILEDALDAFAASKGLAYLYGEDGRITLRCELGYSHKATELSDFFGFQDLLTQAMARREPVRLSSPVEADLLERAEAATLLIAPLVLAEESVGALVMASAERDLAEDWLTYAEALGNHVGQAVGLARAISEVRKSEERYRRIVTTANEGIVTVDYQGIMTFVNARMGDLLGYSADELMGRHITELVHPEDRAASTALADRLRRGSRQIEDRKFLRKDGSSVWLVASVTPLRGEHGEHVGSLGMYTDVTARKQAEEALAHQALHDSLTGLPNRALLQEYLGHSIRSARRDQRYVALLIMDLDRFKQVNDVFGHHCGDLLLQEIAVRLRGALKASDFLGRLGGDEFAIVATGCETASSVLQLARRVLQTVQSRFVLEGQVFEMSASIGVAIFPEHGEDPNTLFRHADVAMYAAKREHLGCELYAPGQDADAATGLLVTTELRAAIERGELLLHYQPKVDIASGRLVAVESLVRWCHPQRGMMYPDTFIPLAEQTGLIKPLTDWVMREAFSQCRRWHDEGLAINIAINQSAHNLHDPNLPADVERLFAHQNIHPSSVTMEITESAIMANPLRAMDVVTQLSAMDVALSIDDFGTGYSSLAYLKRLPAKELKVDKSFVMDMIADENDAMIVKSTIDLAHNLGLKVVAEGVETAEIWNGLAALGCDVAQGYYLARPMPANELEAWAKESPFGWRR